MVVVLASFATNAKRDGIFDIKPTPSSQKDWPTMDTTSFNVVGFESWTVSSVGGVWETHSVSNPYWDKEIFFPVCWQNTDIFGYNRIGKDIVRFNIASSTWSIIGKWPETYTPINTYNSPNMILWSESDKLVFVGANYGDIDPKKVKVFDIKTATWDPLWVS
jgi:hypothetical protein